MGQDADRDDAARLLEEAIPFRPALAHYFQRKLRSVDEVEDLIQEVYLRIAARRSAEPVSNLGGYIFQIAASVLADRHRRRVVRHHEDHVPFEPEDHGGADFDAAHILESRQNLDVALETLQSLPERTRTILVLRRLDGCAYRDIAEQLGISVSAVEKHMIRAVQCLLQVANRERR